MLTLSTLFKNKIKDFTLALSIIKMGFTYTILIIDKFKKAVIFTSSITNHLAKELLV